MPNAWRRFIARSSSTEGYIFICLLLSLSVIKYIHIYACVCLSVFIYMVNKRIMVAIIKVSYFIALLLFFLQISAKIEKNPPTLSLSCYFQHFLTHVCDITLISKHTLLLRGPGLLCILHFLFVLDIFRVPNITEFN